MSRRNVLAWVWALVVVLLLAHNATLWFWKRIVPDTDLLALLPVEERDPMLQLAFTRITDTLQQRLIVLVGAADWTRASRAADAYGAVLARHPEQFQVADSVTDQVQRDWLTPFQTHRLTLLTPQDEAALRTQPKEYWVDLALNKLYSPFAGVSLGTWRDDPFGLFGTWVQARAQETPVRPRDGKLFVGDEQRQYVVLPLTLRAPAFSISAQQAVSPVLEQAREAAKRAGPDVDLITVGVALHAAAASAQAGRELSMIGIGSIVGIALLTWFAFRSLKPIAWIMLSIGIGCLGALSVSWLAFGRIHLLTLVFGATLIGVAQDYGIYFLCHRLAKDSQLDSWQLLRRMFPALLLAVVTTVIGYLALALTPFPGLRQMALFSAVGLVFAWLTVVVWFPVLVRFNTLKEPLTARGYAAASARWPLLRFDRRTSLAAVLFLAFVVFGLSRLGVRDDIRSLQNPPKKLIDDQIKASKLLDAPAPAQFFIVRGATAEVVLEREELLKQRLDPLIERNLVGGYQALSNWVPSSRTQAARRALVEEKLFSDDGALATLMARLGENTRWFRVTRDRLLASASPLKLDDFLKSPAGEPWRHLWLGPVEGQYASVVALRGLGAAGLPVLPSLAAGLDGVQWVDKVGEISSLLGRYRQYMGWVVLFSYGAVFGLLYPRYRGRSWRALAPAALASIATLALLGSAGQHLQLFHVLALMLLLGIGVDYGIFIQEQAGRRDHAAGLAVGLSAMSTLLSFGLLGLSKTPALQAFGVTMLIGIAVVWLIAPCLGRDETEKE